MDWLCRTWPVRRVRVGNGVVLETQSEPRGSNGSPLVVLLPADPLLELLSQWRGRLQPEHLSAHGSGKTFRQRSKR